MNAKRPCIWSDWNRIQSGGIPLSSVRTPTEIEPEIAALEAKLAKARQIKQGMMHNLLTGRIRLP